MNETNGSKAKRDRSPAYPYIPIGLAVQRLAELDEYFKRHPAPFSKLGLAWEMKAASSQAASIAAALKAYGLVEYQGTGPDLKLALSDDGRTYLRAQQPDIKEQIVRRCALKPKSIARYFAEWGSDRPPDPVCLDELVLKGKFSQGGAEAFLKVYDSTIAYAGLQDSDKLGQGDELEKGPLGENDPVGEDPSEKPKGKLSPPKALDLEVPGMRQDVFTLEEGAITIQWPAVLSPESYEDFKDWLEILQRKIGRSVTAKKDEEADQ